MIPIRITRALLVLLVSFTVVRGHAHASTLGEVYSLVNSLKGSEQARPMLLAFSKHGRPIVGVAVTDPSVPASDKTRIVVVSGQHGNEPHAALSTAHLAVNWANDPNLADIRRNSIVLIIPAANPDGLAYGTRCGSSGADPNRDWNRRSLPETRAIARVIDQWKPHLVIDEHEWSDTDGHRFNCVELSQSTANRSLTRLAKRIRGASISPEFRSIDSQPGRDTSLLHRHFCAAGYLSYLVETSPRENSASKRQLYSRITEALARQTIAHRMAIESCTVSKGAYALPPQLVAVREVQPSGPNPSTNAVTAIVLVSAYCLVLACGWSKRPQAMWIRSLRRLAASKVFVPATPHGMLPELTYRSLASRQIKRGRRIAGRAGV